MEKGGRLQHISIFFRTKHSKIVTFGSLFDSQLDYLKKFISIMQWLLFISLSSNHTAHSTILLHNTEVKCEGTFLETLTCIGHPHHKHNTDELASKGRTYLGSFQELLLLQEAPKAKNSPKWGLLFSKVKAGKSSFCSNNRKAHLLQLPELLPEICFDERIIDLSVYMSERFYFEKRTLHSFTTPRVRPTKSIYFIK